MIQTTTINAGKIVTSQRLHVLRCFSQSSVLYHHLVDQIAGTFRRNLCFLIVYIQLHQIDTTSDVFPPPARLHANNWRKTDPPPALLGDFSDPKEQLMFSKLRARLHGEFQPGLKLQPGFWNKSSQNQVVDYMERDSARGVIQPGLKILARSTQTGLGFSARANGLKNLKKSHVIETEFQPGLKSWKQDGCRYEVEAISVE